MGIGVTEGHNYKSQHDCHAKTEKISITPDTWETFVILCHTHSCIEAYNCPYPSLSAETATTYCRMCWRPPPRSERGKFPHTTSSRRQPERNTGGGLLQGHRQSCGREQNMREIVLYDCNKELPNSRNVVCQWKETGVSVKRRAILQPLCYSPFQETLSLHLY